MSAVQHYARVHCTAHQQEPVVPEPMVPERVLRRRYALSAAACAKPGQRLARAPVLGRPPVLAVPQRWLHGGLQQQRAACQWVQWLL